MKHAGSFWNGVAALALATNLFAQGGPQCGFEWQSVGGYPGADGIVECGVEWDPDGAGPAPTLAVLGGQFSVVGSAVASHLALYEPITDTWSGLGGGMDGPVYALLPLPNGDLIAAGEFAHAGGVACSNVARWDGTAWQPLGGVNNGTDGLVVALALLPSGDVVAGGAFASAGGVAAANVARFDGASWSSLGVGCNARVNALAVAANGELIVGGQFTAAGGVAADHLARWNGVWSSIANGAGAEVLSIAITAANELVVVVVSLECVRVWDGAVWSTRAGGFGLWEGAAMVRVLSGGQLVVGSRPVFGDARLLTWDGSAWSSPVAVGGSQVSMVRCVVELGNGQLLVGGRFSSPLPNLIRVVGTQRVAIPGGPDAPCAAIVETDTGEIVVGTTAGLRHAVATGWGVYGDGYEVLLGPIASWPGQGVVSLGSFTYTWYDYWGNAYYAYYPARVVTQFYSYQIPTGLPAPFGLSSTQVMGMAAIRRRDGSVLLSVTGQSSSSVMAYGATGVIFGGVTGFPSAPTALADRGDQDWIAAASGIVYRALGGSLSVIGTAGAEVRCLATAPNGDVYAGGQFTSIDGVSVDRLARWDGATWHAVGGGLDGMVRAILPLPNGDVVVGGAFQHAGGVAAPYLARWDGTAWSNFGASPGAPVEALTQDRLGRIWVGGLFTTVGSTACSYLARLDPICPGTATSYGTGCSGAGGANTLTATSLPWRGATFRSRVEGMRPASIAVVAVGFQPLALPLAQLFPFALPGCDLLTTPDVTWLTLTGTGTVDLKLFLPTASVWLGQQLRQQVIGVELDIADQLSGLSSSNALLLTVGQL